MSGRANICWLVCGYLLMEIVCFGLNMSLHWIDWTVGIKIRLFLSVLINIRLIRRTFRVSCSFEFAVFSRWLSLILWLYLNMLAISGITKISAFWRSVTSLHVYTGVVCFGKYMQKCIGLILCILCVFMDLHVCFGLKMWPDWIYWTLPVQKASV